MAIVSLDIQSLFGPYGLATNVLNQQSIISTTAIDIVNHQLIISITAIDIFDHRSINSTIAIDFWIISRELIPLLTDMASHNVALSAKSVPHNLS